MTSVKNYGKMEEKMRMNIRSIMTHVTAFLLGMVVALAFLNFTENSGTMINIPEGLGKEHSYVAWQFMNAPSTVQNRLREESGMNFDTEGFGVIDGRYVIACTDTYGMVGDRVDFHKANGQVIHAVIGDIKNRRSPGCNVWGDRDGQNIIEFVVDKDTWYTGHAVPGSAECHPEWDSETVKAVNFGKEEFVKTASAK